MDAKRHVCIICKSKKTANKMIKNRSHWYCISCVTPSKEVPADPGVNPAADLPAAGIPGSQIWLQKKSTGGIKILNLYAGIGGNRKHWKGCQVTAVELNPLVSAAYKKLYPDDEIIIGDAHKYLLNNMDKYDFIWSSPPCQSHSITNFYLNQREKKRYPDMSLYEEIIILSRFYKGKFVIENVRPYYEALIKPTKKLSKHLFWANFPISDFNLEYPQEITKMENMIQREISDWLGIKLEKNIYLSAKKSIQVFRNCVHPDIGESIFNDYIKSMQAV